jgi:hypothetical protein
MKRSALLLELNAFTWLSALKTKYDRRLTLASVPDAEWRAVRARGFDAVWLMGVWKRSPKARQHAFQFAELKADFTRVLPGWKDEDVAGSAYAIGDYRLDPFLGAPSDLEKVRAAVNAAGLKLILDFVPNHVAFDHPWTLKHPDRLVRPTPTERRAHPERFFKPAGGAYLAHGRDPYFFPWTDTAQIDAFSPEARWAMRETLERIALVADGVRCDMAMLVLNDVFKKTWGPCVPAAPRTEFWEEVLGPVKEKHPRFTAIAEVYWNLGQKLLSLGFDYIYDKTLYDRFIEGDAARIREHLHDSAADQERQLRFVENHDEPRLFRAFGHEKGLAAQAAVMTLPGLKLVHQDQEKGYLDRVPVQLRAFTGPDLTRVAGPSGGSAYAAGFVPDELARVLTFASDLVLSEGSWHLLTPHEAWPGGQEHHTVLAWIWTRGHAFRLIVVNYGPQPAQARLRLPEACLIPAEVELEDAPTGQVYRRSTQELRAEGLYVRLDGWKYHLFAVREGCPV